VIIEQRKTAGGVCRLSGRFVLALFLGLFCATAARAQFVGFGQNKVQYSDFDWRILAGEHVDLYYYPEEEEIAYLALKEAEEVYEKLSLKFNHHVFRRIPLIIFSAHHYFQQTNITWSFIPEGVGGFTEFLKGRVALPFNGSFEDFRHVLHLELVHVFQISKANEACRTHPNRIKARLPLWWTEGLAEEAKVLAVKIGEEIKVYPIDLLIRHEVVNDVMGGRQICASYCILADLWAVYDRSMYDTTFTFAVSGYTYFDPEYKDGRDAFVLWDRETESLWWPLENKAVSGPMIDKQMKPLEEKLWFQATWGELKSLHPDAVVLAPGQILGPQSGRRRINVPEGKTGLRFPFMPFNNYSVDGLSGIGRAVGILSTFSHIEEGSLEYMVEIK